jgi:hypothetical protein
MTTTAAATASEQGEEIRDGGGHVDVLIVDAAVSGIGAAHRSPDWTFVVLDWSSGDAVPDVASRAGYPGSKVECKPWVFTPYIGGAGPLRMKCDEFAAHNYEALPSPGEPSPASGSGVRIPGDGRLHRP